MTAAARPGVLRVCAGCGGEFEDVSNRSRLYCYGCAPPRGVPKRSLGGESPAGVAGRPFTVEHFRAWALGLVLDTGDPWVVEDYFAAFLEDLFGGVPECWLLVPEGNAKTTGMAGLVLYHCEFMPYAWVPWAAASRDQAEIGYIQAEGFVERSPRLRGAFKCHPGYRRIRHLVSGARLQIFAADERTGDGVIPTLAVLDELHRHRSLRLYRTWRGKLAKRGGQLVTISTAGEPGSEFEETRERIRRAAVDMRRDGCFVRAASPRMVLHDWAVPEDGDVEDMAVVKAANPFSAITVDVLREKFESPTMTLPHWRRFVCNLPTRSDFAAITEAEWESARSDDRIPRGERVWVGLDVAWKWDTTALVPLWMPRKDLRLLGPAVILEPPRDGQSLDPHRVEAAIVALNERNPVETVVMDTHRAEQLASWIEETLGCVVVDRPQSNTFAVEDYERFMEGLRNGWLRHSGDEGLGRHALNAVARMLPRGDARFDRPTRSRDGDQSRHVIDALVAASMVHSAAVTVVEKPKARIVSW